MKVRRLTQPLGVLGVIGALPGGSGFNGPGYGCLWHALCMGRSRICWLKGCCAKKQEGDKMKLATVTALVVAGAVAACGPMSSGRVQDLNVKDWIGHSSQHLIQSWGAPHHDDPMAGGDRAIGYLIVNQAITGPKSQVIFRAQRCMVSFTVRADGIIDDANATGSQCRIGPHAEMHPPASKT